MRLRLVLVSVAVLAVVALSGWWLLAPDRRLVRWRPDPEARARDLRQLIGASGRIAEAWKPEPGPDILVIVLDTVRADHLGVYGYDRETSPRLDAWAQDARVYDRVMADAPWTLPSHASLFTGRWPISHGARGLTPEQAGGADIRGFAAPLARGAHTVARALRARGYLTAGIAANRAFLERTWGLDQGFGMWFCEGFGPDRRKLPYPTADRVTAVTRAFLERPRRAPLFLFVNYMDAHTPWLPREGYVRDPGAIDRRVLPEGRRWEEVSVGLLADRELEDTTRRAWVEAYDSELRFLDEHLAELLDALPALGIDEQDYVFILADHGEYLGEHHLVEHSKDVYDTVLHVPLLVRGPGYTAGRDAIPLQHHDLAGMILAAAGLGPLPGAQPTGDLQVAELYGTRKKDLHHPRYGERFERVRRAYRVGEHSMVLGSDGSEEFYDLAADPGQLRPLTEPPWAAAMRARARDWLAAVPVAPLAGIEGPVNVEALRALGYWE